MLIRLTNGIGSAQVYETFSLTHKFHQYFKGILLIYFVNVAYETYAKDASRCIVHRRAKQKFQRRRIERLETRKKAFKIN